MFDYPNTALLHYYLPETQILVLVGSCVCSQKLVEPLWKVYQSLDHFSGAQRTIGLLEIPEFQKTTGAAVAG